MFIDNLMCSISASFCCSVVLICMGCICCYEYETAVNLFCCIILFIIWFCKLRTNSL